MSSAGRASSPDLSLDGEWPRASGGGTRGFVQTGNERELGPAEYRVIEHIWTNTALEPAGWFAA